MRETDRCVGIVSFKKRKGGWSKGKRFFEGNIKMLKGVLAYHIEDLKANGKSEFCGRIVVNGEPKYALSIDGNEWR